MNIYMYIYFIPIIRNRAFFLCQQISVTMATIVNNGTTQQKLPLDLNGYSYIMDRSTNEKTYCLCINYYGHHCRSRLHTCIITNNVVKPPTDHTYKFNGTTLERQKFDGQIISHALNTQETSDITFTHCYKGKIILFRRVASIVCKLILLLLALSDSVLARLPSCANIKRRTRKLRQRKDIAQAPSDPNLLIVPVQLTKTVRHDQFLRCDTGSGV